MFLISLTAFFYLDSHYLLYNDEMATMLEMRMPFKEMIGFIFTQDIHPPFYFILLKIWTFVFGNTVYIARCFSYIGLLACAFGGGYMVKRLYGEKAGVWYTALFLFLPVSFWLIGTIRMYSWACFFCTAAFLSAQSALMKNEKKDFILYVAFSFSGAWTHYYASFMCALIALIFLGLSWKKNRKAFKRFFIADAVLFLTVFPEISFFIRQNEDEMNWIQKSHVFDAWRELTVYYYEESFFYAAPAFIMFSLWILGFRFLLDGRKSGEKDFAKTGLFVSLIFFVSLFGVSLTVKPCLVGRYLWLIHGCLYVFFLFGFLNDRGGRVLVTLLLLFSFVSQVFMFKEAVNQSVQPLFYRMVQKNIRPDDVIVATDWRIAYWLYYHFPDHDVRVLPTGQERLLRKKQRLIDEKGIFELLKEKDVFVTQSVSADISTEKLFDAFDTYMQAQFTLEKINKSL